MLACGPTRAWIDSVPHDHQTSERTSQLSVKDQIRPAVDGPLAALGLLVEDVAVTSAGKRRLVRIWIDRVLPESADATTTVTEPLTLDEVADATRAVSDALDESDAMGEQPYTLEVSSPGVGRPLTQPRHFRRNVGRLLTVQHDGGEVTGRVVAASTTEVTLEVPATKAAPGRTETLPYAAVERAVVQVEFARPDPSQNKDS